MTIRRFAKFHANYYFSISNEHVCDNVGRCGSDFSEIKFTAIEQIKQKECDKKGN